MSTTGDRGPLGSVIGPALAVVVIPVTVFLAATLPRFTLNSALLVLLLEVVVVAALSHVVVAAVTAVAAFGMANWFLVQPRHTFAISNPDDVVTLTVFVLAAVGASVVVSRALRTRESATRASTEAAFLRTSVETPAEEADPNVVLERARTLFALDGLELVDPSGAVIAAAPASGAAGTGTDATRADAEPPDRRQRQAALPDGYVLRTDGPKTLGLDQQMLTSLGTAALRTWQARELAAGAAHAEEIAAMDRARSALLAGVGHDLRTPIAAISVSAAALRSGVSLPDADREELVATISESAARLDELVENLLDMSRLEAGQLITHLQPVDAEDLLAEVALAASTSRIDVRAEPCEVVADSGLLKRVLANLLSNALRHSPPDRPVVLEAEPAGDRVRLRVVDHGAGLSPGSSPEDLFRPFQTASDRSTGGVGLGLAIARGFVEAMDGTIHAQPTPGGGLTMVVELVAAR